SLAANRAEPAGNSRRIGGWGVEYRHRRDLPHAEFDKALDRIDPVECEFLDPDFGAERHRFLPKPLGAGQIARCSGAVEALPIPGGQPRRGAGLRLLKIRKRCGLHCGSIDEGGREDVMADAMKWRNLKNPRAQARGYSQAVVTEGGRVVWLAGQVAGEDSSGRSL